MKAYIGPYQEHDLPRITQIEIDKYDSWSADQTIAMIAAPIIKQLKETNHGFAFVKAEDCPEELRTTGDDRFAEDEERYKEQQARWQYVQGEILWAMEEIASGKPGYESFYEYPETLPESISISEMLKQTKVNKEGLENYAKRLQNGCELFGKYFMDLWD